MTYYSKRNISQYPPICGMPLFNKNNFKDWIVNDGTPKK